MHTTEGTKCPFGTFIVQWIWSWSFIRSSIQMFSVITSKQFTMIQCFKRNFRQQRDCGSWVSEYLPDHSLVVNEMQNIFRYLEFPIFRLWGKQGNIFLNGLMADKSPWLLTGFWSAVSDWWHKQNGSTAEKLFPTRRLTNLLSKSQQQQSLRKRTTRPRMKSMSRMLATVKSMSMMDSFSISWRNTTNTLTWPTNTRFSSRQCGQTQHHNNLADVSLPALVLLRKAVLLKQSTLVGRASSAVYVIQDSCHGDCCGVTLLSEVNHGSVVTFQLMLRDGSQQGTGVR